MNDSNPAESMDAEGIPELEDHPPGTDIELDQDSMMSPRDYPVAAGSDPAYPVTAAEERTPESVGDRAARENPDFGEPGRSSRTASVPPDSDLPPDSNLAESAEEAAVHVRSEDDV